MTNCSTIIDIMHNVIDTIPVTYDIINMVNLIDSLSKLVGMYMSQCFHYHMV